MTPSSVVNSCTLMVPITFLLWTGVFIDIGCRPALKPRQLLRRTRYAKFDRVLRPCKQFLWRSSLTELRHSHRRLRACQPCLWGRTDTETVRARPRLSDRALICCLFTGRRCRYDHHCVASFSAGHDSVAVAFVRRRSHSVPPRHKRADHPNDRCGGGSAFLFGHSSGGCLAREAARNLGAKVAKVAVYEVPYNDDPAAQRHGANTSVTSPRRWRMAGEVMRLSCLCGMSGCPPSRSPRCQEPFWQASRRSRRRLPMTTPRSWGPRARCRSTDWQRWACRRSPCAADRVPRSCARRLEPSVKWCPTGRADARRAKT